MNIEKWIIETNDRKFEQKTLFHLKKTCNGNLSMNWDARTVMQISPESISTS